jgi:hypothetical protein
MGTLNVRNLCMSGSLKTVAREKEKYKIDLVGQYRAIGSRGNRFWGCGLDSLGSG